MWHEFKVLVFLTLASLFLSSVAYPLFVLTAGNVLCPDRAKGSIMYSSDGQPIGSSLIAQKFKGDEWFQPRPSAGNYQGNVSSASNFAANQPKLRYRVAQTCGEIASYRLGIHTTSVQQDIANWFAQHPDLLLSWSQKFPQSASNWPATRKEVMKTHKK